MKLEISPLEMLPHHLRATADFLNALAAGPAAAPKPQAAATGAGNTPPPPPPLADTTASDADDTSSTENSSNATSQNGATDTADLDKNGLPWDARIHSGSRGKNQDGSWKQLRGVNKDIIPGVEAELRALLGNVTTATGATTGASASTGTPASGAAQTNDAPPPPPPLADDVPPPPPVIEGAVDFGKVFQRVTALQKHPEGSKLPQELLNEALGMVGLSSMKDFMANKDKAPELMDAINLLVGEE